MDKKHSNTLYMWKAVSDVLSDNRAVWEGRPAFSNAVAAFEAFRAKIGSFGDLQAQGGKGVTRRKNSLRSRAINAGCQAALNLKAWAEDHDNDALAAAMQVSRSGLSAEADPSLAELLGKILELSVANKEGLADYDTDEALLAELETALNGFRKLIAAPKTANANRAAATGNIAATFRGGRTALARLDDLVGNFSRTHPDFVVVFRKARKAAHNGERHLPDVTGDSAA